MARIVLLSEGLTGRIFELKAEKTTVGRLPDNAFAIPEASVSSHHAEFQLKGNELLVKDLDSTNGTFINGERITETTLKAGQVFRLGTVDMRFELGDAPPSAAASTAASMAAARKMLLDQTRIIPQGVKLDDIEGVRTPLNTSKDFQRKSNKGTLIFIIAAVAAAIVLVVLLLMTVFKQGAP
jgi:pSer/pThr/pTyr-binding forkhead associated (FHA) protein